MVTIINPGAQDYHSHSLNYSDGLSEIEIIVERAGKIGLEELAITDHSQACAEAEGYSKKCPRSLIKRWQNIHNQVNIIFGIEGDLLNEEGDICDHIQGQKSNFLILSAHRRVYQGDPTKITQAYIKAIQRHHQKLKFIAHPCLSQERFNSYIDIIEISKAMNDHGLPGEVNGSSLIRKACDLKRLETMLSIINEVYVNSDTHMLSELEKNRKSAFQYLKENKYIN